ncbi:MAG: hypothetical protein P8J77_06395 [Flavobacteriales bacterium]|nr:hypothetical protein [Flavobacteriales bacterium]
MDKKYYIEKKDLDLLPLAYSSIAKEYADNFDRINKKQQNLMELKEKINKLRINLNELNSNNKRLFNQLKFIKKSYVPRVYIKVYQKNNNAQYYVHAIIRHFGVSRTVYLGKKDFLSGLLYNNIKSFNKNRFSTILLKFIKPIIHNYLLSITNKNDFVNCTLNSRLFFSSLNSERQDTYTFSEYLRSLSSD